MVHMQISYINNINIIKLPIFMMMKSMIEWRVWWLNIKVDKRMAGLPPGNRNHPHLCLCWAFNSQPCHSAARFWDVSCQKGIKQYWMWIEICKATITSWRICAVNLVNLHEGISHDQPCLSCTINCWYILWAHRFPLHKYHLFKGLTSMDCMER